MADDPIAERGGGLCESRPLPFPVRRLPAVLDATCPGDLPAGVTSLDELCAARGAGQGLSSSAGREQPPEPNLDGRVASKLCESEAPVTVVPGYRSRQCSDMDSAMSAGGTPNLHCEVGNLEDLKKWMESEVASQLKAINKKLDNAFVDGGWRRRQHRSKRLPASPKDWRSPTWSCRSSERANDARPSYFSEARHSYWSSKSEAHSEAVGSPVSLGNVKVKTDLAVEPEGAHACPRSSILDHEILSVVNEFRGSCGTSAADMQSMTSMRKNASSRSERQVNRQCSIMECFERCGSRRRRCPVSAMIWEFLEEPNSSMWATSYSTAVQCLIFISVVMTMAEGLTHSWEFAVAWDTAFEVIFLVEIVVRWSVSPHHILFCFSWFNAIDILATTSLCLRVVRVLFFSDGGCEELSLCGSVWTLTQSLVPVLRLLKMLRRFGTFHLLISAFRLAFEALPVLIFTLTFIVLAFSSIIYLVEPRDNIVSLSHAMWFAIVTMTTVGYGDVAPVTVGGKIVTAVLMVISALYMAVPIGIVGNAFNSVWEDRDRLLLVQRARQCIIQRGYKARDIDLFFELYASKNLEGLVCCDIDAERFLDINDFRRMVVDLRLGLREERLLQLFTIFDHDGNGIVEAEEFERVLFPRSRFDSIAQLTRAA